MTGKARGGPGVFHRRFSLRHRLDIVFMNSLCAGEIAPEEGSDYSFVSGPAIRRGSILSISPAPDRIANVSGVLLWTPTSEANALLRSSLYSFLEVARGVWPNKREAPEMG